MYFINSHCQITASKAIINGRTCFKMGQKRFTPDEFFHALYNHLKIDYRKFFRMDAMTKLGFLASELLLNGIDREKPKPDMGILIFNRSSSLEADVNFQKTMQHYTDFFPSPSGFVYTLPNIITGEIAIRNKIYGETVFYIMEKFYTYTIIPIIEDMMFSTGLKCVLAGWVEFDPLENKQDCFMMLCSSKECENSNACLPAGFDHVYTGEFLDLEACLKGFYNNN